MLVDYIVANPTGNITVLVTTPVDKDSRFEVVQEMFNKVPTCEQVGFITIINDSTIKLEMMGGEFCGNATISAAAHLASVTGLEQNHQAVICVESSGIDHPVPVIIKCLGNNSYIGTLEMPTPTLIYYDGCPLVHLDGISHLLIPAGNMSVEELETSIKKLATEINTLALGIVQYEEDENGVTIIPLVYVPASETLVWENGCASASIAVGYYRYMQNNANTSTDVLQPGGTIRISVENNRILLTGNVHLT